SRAIVIEMNVGQQNGRDVSERNAGIREVPMQGRQGTRGTGIDEGDPAGAVQDRTRNHARAILKVQVEVRHAGGKRLHHFNLIEMVLGSGFWVLGSGFWVLGSGFWVRAGFEPRTTNP